MNCTPGAGVSAHGMEGRRVMGLAVITRTGALVHWPDVSARRHAQTICGREWVNLYTPNASASAVTCRPCRAALAAQSVRDSVDPNDIPAHRAAGWPDFHPETYCHRCGRRNPLWFSPEWAELTGGHGGILCPPCFTEHDPDAFWMVTRYHPPGADAVALLSASLQAVSSLGDDATRVARCLIDSGWTRRFQEGGA